MHRLSAFWHMRLPHRLQGQKVKSQSDGAGAYCGGHLAAQLVSYTLALDSPLRKLNYVIFSSAYSLVRGFLCSKQTCTMTVCDTRLDAVTDHRQLIALAPAGIDR